MAQTWNSLTDRERARLITAARAEATADYQGRRVIRVNEYEALAVHSSPDASFDEVDPGIFAAEGDTPTLVGVVVEAGEGWALYSKYPHLYGHDTAAADDDCGVEGAYQALPVTPPEHTGPSGEPDGVTPALGVNNLAAYINARRGLMSPEAIAQQTGLPVGEVEAYLSGEGSPSWGFVFAVARGVGLHPVELGLWAGLCTEAEFRLWTVPSWGPPRGCVGVFDEGLDEDVADSVGERPSSWGLDPWDDGEGM